jgi:NADPH-dependent 2,4-dienoyl-CoA reductase/sulfur reductase-like enzyme
MAFVRDRIKAGAESSERVPADVGRVVIIGGGAAGLACAHELRKLGHRGAITMLSADGDAPCDRPNLSKDYLAGTAPAEWLPLRSDDWYKANGIDLRLGVEVDRVDPVERRILTAARERIDYDRLLLATGSEPNRLRSPGFDGDTVFTLRSMSDAATIGAAAKPGARAVIVGSSFLGLEAAAALRQRGVEVTIVSPEHVPFERTFGAEVGRTLQRLHERNGVRFRLGTVAASYDGRTVKLANGTSADADFALVAIGVRPRVRLAEAMGIRSEGGVPVNAHLETCHPGVFAAGDIAAYPDPRTGEPVRIEHWVTAERQGQVAAANMLGHRRRFDAVPFFWTEQFGVALRYVGHAPGWDKVEIDGDIDVGDFIARYSLDGEHRASVASGRDLAILEDERLFERRNVQALSTCREPRRTDDIESGATRAEASGGV